MAVELQLDRKMWLADLNRIALMFGEWRHELHGVIEGCSNRLVVTISHKARVGFSKGPFGRVEERKKMSVNAWSL